MAWLTLADSIRAPKTACGFCGPQRWEPPVNLRTFPSIGVTLVWGFFGLTNILFFYSALIKATRSWGGDTQQGLAYGLLDGGRGLIAAVLQRVAYRHRLPLPSPSKPR